MSIDLCSDCSTGGTLNMNWNQGMSTESSQSANRGSREGRSLAVSRAQAQRRRRSVENRASEELGSTLRHGLEHPRSTEPSLAWVADAPLLPDEPSVHIASRIGIVAVEATGARDAVPGLRCCRQRLNGPVCPCRPVTNGLNGKRPRE
jgi:hypothetical protein